MKIDYVFAGYSWSITDTIIIWSNIAANRMKTENDDPNVIHGVCM